MNSYDRIKAQLERSTYALERLLDHKKRLKAERDDYEKILRSIALSQVELGKAHWGFDELKNLAKTVLKKWKKL